MNEQFLVVAKNVPVVGVTFHKEAMEKVSQDPHNSVLKLVPEPDNEYDPNALAVVAVIGEEEHKVGYLPKELAKKLSENFDGEELSIRTTKAFEYEGSITGFRVEVLYEHH